MYVGGAARSWDFDAVEPSMIALDPAPPTRPVISMSSLWVYALLFAITAGESSAFLGLVIPGEAAVLGAGALAARGELALVPAIAVVVVGAVVGDTIGYSVGKRFGGSPQSGPLARVWSCQRMVRVRTFLDKHGRNTVFLARFVGFFRALVPFAAGAVRMPYRPFLAYNVAGALTWGIGTVLIGYWTGDTAIGTFESSSRYFVAAAAVGALGYLLWRWTTRRTRAARAAGALARLESHPVA